MRGLQALHPPSPHFLLRFFLNLNELTPLLTPLVSCLSSQLSRDSDGVDGEHHWFPRFVCWGHVSQKCRLPNDNQTLTENMILRDPVVTDDDFLVAVDDMNVQVCLKTVTGINNRESLMKSSRSPYGLRAILCIFSSFVFSFFSPPFFTICRALSGFFSSCG